MKLKSLLCIILLYVSVNSLFAQESKDLYMVNEIKQAYENGTRSFDAKPGKKYFTNRADYKISADFDPETAVIKGNETIYYQNNSPDSLSQLIFNLYQDIFKKGNARNWDLGAQDIHDGVQISKLLINNTEIDLKSKEVVNNSSILSIELKNKIIPNSKNTIEIEWNLVIPKAVPVRHGMYGDKNYMIAYWFPKMAVYDDIVGWDTQGYVGNCEFYNDFGNYEIEINLPAEYIAWSNGLLQNGNEIFNQKYLDRLEKAYKSEEICHIITIDDYTENNIFKKTNNRLWKFKLNETPDISFAVSKSYLWDATSIKSGNKNVLINAVYKRNTKDFFQVCDVIQKSIKYFTNESPGITYPYPQLTAFNGGGGMEFPGMINDGDFDIFRKTVYVTSHEAGHSYFPFSTGLNEKKYAWMDEGLMTVFARDMIVKLIPENKKIVFDDLIQNYNITGGTFADIPLMISSENANNNSYRFYAYTRSSIALIILRDYLGQENFNKSLQIFAENWKSKHPTPYDLFFTFNEISKQDLAWFWKPWFFELASADLSLKNPIKNDNETIISIENKGGLPVPIFLKITYSDNTTEIIERKANIWKTTNNKIIEIKINKKNIINLELGTNLIPDTNIKDNNLDL